ncbi:hypothetical protein HNI00_11915 [Thermoleptolyngbya oregonensis NK1-22]|uniref:Polymerase nucleotidyl transferase domain-containing protein n=1 Tax=Thermoleptolyngbya oregonensis NK1-22 TaxID=2547457 RepID=A0AA97BD25_9CYAN|nr:hypothetical protein HNI00_11915 [Thermoleptolyngbya oregonensis NK1-22]
MSDCAIAPALSLMIDLPMGQIVEFCDRWQVVEFALFGSVLREDFRPDSDIDVMVQFHAYATLKKSRCGCRQIANYARSLARYPGGTQNGRDRFGAANSAFGGDRLSSP